MHITIFKEVRFLNLAVQLFWIFAKIGLFTIGGGYAIFPVIKKELIDNRGWITEEELLDYFAIGQCTPGIIAVNVATFVGKKIGGFFGALAATLGVVFPSFIIIVIIAGVVKNFSDIWFVQSAFSGIRIVAIILILNTVLSMWKKSVKGIFGYLVFLFAFFVSFFDIFSSVMVVIICGAIGIIYTVINSEKKDGGESK